MEKDIHQFLLDKEMEDWVKKNPDLLKDSRELCEQAVFFKMKWGIPVKIVFDKDYKEPVGRNLGVESVEKLFIK